MTMTSASSPGRLLQPGDRATTDYSGRGRTTTHTIVDRSDTREHGPSQSGIMFRVTPPVRGSCAHHWIDADWFTPVDQAVLRRARG